MAKDRDDELNDELNKDMDGTADLFAGDEYTLEEILAEFGDKPAPKKSSVTEDTIIFRLPRNRPAAPTSAPGRGPGKVVPFPTGEPARTPPEPPAAKPSAPKPPAAKTVEVPPSPPPEDNVLEFPGAAAKPPSEHPIADRLNRLVQKADKYAEHMFEDEGTERDEEVLRAERYIPGTDLEEEESRGWLERRPRRKPPPAPDLPPAELARRYQKGLKSLRVRMVLVFLVALAALGLTFCALVGAELPENLTPRIQQLALAGLLVFAMLLGVDVLIRGFFQLLRLQLEMDTLLLFSCIAALADAVTMDSLDPRGGQMPYCALAALAIGFFMRGTWLKRRGQRVACRTAAAAAHPYLVTLDEDKWNGRDTYAKWSGQAVGFGRQIQASDGAERIFHVICPLLLVACLMFSLVSSVGQDAPERLLWCLSATLTAASSFSGALCFGPPWHKLCQRLSKSGGAIAGWDGVTATGGSGILLTDVDLFPPGCVSINGIKIFGDFPVDKVVSCSATLIRDAGSGLDKVFHDLLRAQGCVYRRSTGFFCHEGSGLSADIRGEQILVGSSSFMHLMEVPLPPGMNVKNAVFCAIDGELAGVFALKYSLHGAVEPALNALIRNRITPVLATRDFNLIPSMLRQRFKLPVEKMEFPPVDRRLELSDEDQEHSDILTAVLCREGVGPYSEAVVGAARLRRAVRLSASLACAGAVVGVLLAFYLTFMVAYSSLSPANLLVFLVMWLVPTPLISGWVNKY